MNTLALRISSRRKELGMTQEELAHKLGYSTKSTISRIEKGDNDIPLNKVDAFAEALQTSRAYIMGWEDDTPSDLPFPKVIMDRYGLKPVKTIKLPLLGTISCGEPTFASEEYEVTVDVDTKVKADYCLMAKGDSMINARIHPGDIVFIRKCSMVDNGEIAVVIIDDDATLKRFYRDPEHQTVTLVAENPAYAPFVYTEADAKTVRVIGKAVMVQSKL